MNHSGDRLSVQVYLGPRSYEVFIVSDELASAADYIDPWLEGRDEGGGAGRRALVVTDHHVARQYARPVAQHLNQSGWSAAIHEIEPGEQSKCLARAAEIFDRLIELGADRRTVVFAVGGGVVGDLAGFAAATFARGVPFVQIPTSLLAQVDSSVGGKVGVNHPRAKNMIGAFHQPLGVLIDTSALDTLPDREFRSGLAEVVKYGMILDSEFLELLEQSAAAINDRQPAVMRRVVARCCRLKADIVEQDEFERTGLRTVLNYGHTFGHALESVCGYGELTHGEAVAVGMVCAARLAAGRGLIAREVGDRQTRLLEAFGLPTRLPGGLECRRTELIECMHHDKKAVDGRLTFVLPVRLGHVEQFSDVAASELDAVLSAAGAV